MSPTSPKVDGYLRKAKRWQAELGELRKILLDCQLTEEIKWRSPCYTFQNSNVVILGTFKEYCALTFVQGALLKDAHGILQKPGANTRGARVLRFTQVSEIVAIESILKAYIGEAVELEKAGLKVDFKKDREMAIPEELQARFDASPALKSAFAALTPGRQRAYLLHFSAPKQSKTRASRIDKCVPQILKGKGLQD